MGSIWYGSVKCTFTHIQQEQHHVCSTMQTASLYNWSACRCNNFVIQVPIMSCVGRLTYNTNLVFASPCISCWQQDNKSERRMAPQVLPGVGDFYMVQQLTLLRAASLVRAAPMAAMTRPPTMNLNLAWFLDFSNPTSFSTCS